MKTRTILLLAAGVGVVGVLYVRGKRQLAESGATSATPAAGVQAGATEAFNQLKTVTAKIGDAIRPSAPTLSPQQAQTDPRVTTTVPDHSTFRLTDAIGWAYRPPTRSELAAQGIYTASTPS